MATLAKMKLKLAVRRLIRDGVYPSPRMIDRELNRVTRNNLNGRDCRWREEVLRELGWTHVNDYSLKVRVRWNPPAPLCLYRGYRRWTWMEDRDTISV